MREKTLDKIGEEISVAVRSLAVDQRKNLAAAVLGDLRKPVGSLRRNG